MAESANLLERELAAAEGRVALLRKAAEAKKLIAELVAEDAGIAGLLLDGLPQQPRPAADTRRGR